MEELTISGLDELDADELRDVVPPEDFRIESSSLPAGSGDVHHEPMTVLAIVVLSAAAIKGLTAWLLKKRHRKTVEFDIEIRRSDGSTERRRVKFDLSESVSEPEVLKQVGQQFGVDPSVIAKLLPHGSA
jgi:hypothetical protein